MCCVKKGFAKFQLKYIIIFLQHFNIDAWCLDLKYPPVSYIILLITVSVTVWAIFVIVAKFYVRYVDIFEHDTFRKEKQEKFSNQEKQEFQTQNDTTTHINMLDSSSTQETEMMSLLSTKD